MDQEHDDGARFRGEPSSRLDDDSLSVWNEERPMSHLHYNF